MSLKTFSARTMPEALALVRRELGGDAVILHTRSYRRGGVLGFGAKPVIEITAMSGTELAKRRTPKRKPPAKPSRPVVRPTTPASVPAAAPEPLAGDLIRRTYAAAKAEMHGSANAFPTAKHPATGRAPQASPTVAIAAPNGSAIDANERFANELAAVRELVQRVAQRQEAAATQPRPAVAASRTSDATADLPDPLVELYTRLIQEEVAEELAEQVVRQADQAGDDAERNASIRRQLATLLPQSETPDCSDESQESDRPRIVALVGPTGVGKTTTVAKLAATHQLKHGRKVGVVTLDTYRIAAVDQLRTYCSIIGCPLEVARQPAELAACIEHLSECDVVLIDTAGRSQRDDAKLDELSAFLAAASPDETHLVLAATASQRVMLQIAERFERVRPDRVIFTKLDEAVTCGTLFNVATKIAKRVSYITTGQEVPHQIEPADALKLAARVLGESPETLQTAKISAV